MKDFKTMKPREVESHLRQVILDTFGNEVEDKAIINAANGFYDVVVVVGPKVYRLLNFRKADTPRIVKALKALGEKK